MRYLFLALSILSTIFIFSNSLLNGNVSIEESDRFTFIVISIVEDITGKSPDYNTISLVVRKLAHFIEFFLAGLFYCLTFFLFKNKRFHFFPWEFAPLSHYPMKLFRFFQMEEALV